MVLVGGAKGWNQETALLNARCCPHSQFPRRPSRTRINRRRRQLQGACNALQRALLSLLDLAQDRPCVRDSLSVPVIRCHLVAGANHADWQAYQARYGKVPSKKCTILGYKLYLLVTLNGVLLDFVLAPGTVLELHVGVELLEEHTDLEAAGDTVIISASAPVRLWKKNRVRPRTMPRCNRWRQASPAERRVVNGARQILETVNSQLTE